MTSRKPAPAQTLNDRAANKAAAFDPGADPARLEEGDHALYPNITISGAKVFAYAHEGELVVSVDLDDALSGEPQVWAAYGPKGDRLVPVRITVQETEVYRATPDQVLLIGEDEPAPEPAAATFTREDVHAAISAAGQAARKLIPRSVSADGNAARDSALDLVLSLTRGLLDDPTRDPAAVIAEQYADIIPDFDGFEVWNEHVNDIGDYCGNSGQPIPRDYDDGTDSPRCPAGCRASAPTDPEAGTQSHNAAIVAAVKGWLE